jgi:hypothetical protein
MRPHDRSVDHVGLTGLVPGELVEDALPHAPRLPPGKPRVDGFPRPEPLRQVAPRRARFHDVQHRVYHPSVRFRRWAHRAGLRRKQRRDPIPLRIAQLVTPLHLIDGTHPTSDGKQFPPTTWKTPPSSRGSSRREASRRPPIRCEANRGRPRSSPGARSDRRAPS